MSRGITIRVLGDYGPFSRIGKSIGYQVTIGGSTFLVDCGSPLFQQIGGEGLKQIKGLIITHCHDDHKRWFSDLALYNMYAPVISSRIGLLTSEEINAGLKLSASPSLETSLSADSRQVIDLSYADYIDFRPLGPSPRYRIVTRSDDCGGSRLCVVDREGNRVGPDRAKIVISSKSGKARLLFRDPVYEEWVEPESFYGYSSSVFYEEERHVHRDNEGFTIEAVKAPVWHGLPGIAIRFSTGTETLLFSSDTMHDVHLWQHLYREKRVPPGLLDDSFPAAEIITGDINDYIERTWSEERYHEAVAAFADALVIHDISSAGSVVHTDYTALDRTMLTKDHTILTHSPDLMTSEWVLSQAGKYFRVEEGRLWELAGGVKRQLDADIYHKESGRFFVGYRNEEGKTAVCRNSDGMLSLHQGDGAPGEVLYRVDLYEDLEGGYFPHIESESASYHLRPDGKVEVIEYDGEGSRGRVVESCRDSLP